MSAVPARFLRSVNGQAPAWTEHREAFAYVELLPGSAHYGDGMSSPKNMPK